MLECEKKILLSKSEFDFLSTHYTSCSSPIVQINHYYDTKSCLLDKLGITCRIRQKNGKFVATVKTHSVDGSGYSEEISAVVKNQFDTTLFDGMNLRYQGSLITLRSSSHALAGIKIDFDKNCYLNHTDYELEVEYDQSKEEETIKLINQMSELLFLCGFTDDSKSLIFRINSGKNKSKRFFERKRGEI